MTQTPSGPRSIHPSTTRCAAASKNYGSSPLQTALPTNSPTSGSIHREIQPPVGDEVTSLKYPFQTLPRIPRVQRSLTKIRSHPRLIPFRFLRSLLFHPA